MTTIATIDVGGEKISVLPKDYQLDPVRDFTMQSTSSASLATPRSRLPFRSLREP